MNNVEKSKRMRHCLITKAMLLPMLVLALVLVAATANALTVKPSGNNAPINGNVVIDFDLVVDNGFGRVELVRQNDSVRLPPLSGGNLSNGNKPIPSNTVGCPTAQHMWWIFSILGHS